MEMNYVYLNRMRLEGIVWIKKKNCVTSISKVILVLKVCDNELNISNESKEKFIDSVKLQALNCLF
jgi:hypothetical protein